MKNWIVVLFLFSVLNVFGQPENTPTEIIAGKKYYVHNVVSGNTLWGIHTLYNVPVEDIVKANPGCEKGINEGQKMIIPVPLETILHQVASKETLFGIAQKYGVTVESILDANPGLESGLGVDQKIKIPGVERGKAPKATRTDTVVVPEKATNTSDSLKAKTVKISFSDTIINHVVLDKETLYSISKRFMVPIEDLQKLNNLKSSKINPGDNLKIPIKKEKIEKVSVREIVPVDKRKVDSTILYPTKSGYRIAILLPFFLDKGENNSDYISTIATEFYMGAKLAIDSLKTLGLNAEVFVFDVKNDTISLKKVLSKPEFNTMDLLIGPLFAENSAVAARWCKEHKIRMVCPVAASPAILKENPFVLNAVPSDVTLMEGLANYTVKKNVHDQIILIKSSNDKDKVLYESYRNAFMTITVVGVRPKLIDATIDNYTTFMKKGMNVILVFPTNEKSLAVKFINSLSTNSAKFESENIFVYGTKDWVNFEDVKPHLKNKFNFHYASPTDLNYKYAETESLHRKYRSTYNADMTKMSVQGFDVFFYFCSDLLLKNDKHSMIMNDFEMVQKGSLNGFENSHVYIIKQQDYEMINVEGK